MADAKFKIQSASWRTKIKIDPKLPQIDYDPQKIEIYWQKVWEEQKIYKTDLDKARKPFYNLMMFPYPSAEGLHVGSFFTFGGIDAYGRFKRMQGYNVFEPIGLDGFGIHSENYALKVGRIPQEHARVSEENFYRQLHMLGNGYDWSRTVETYNPDYYKWTQWLFTELFKAGLSYKAKAAVNFCPSCKTVLSDEQVVQKTSKKDVILRETKDPHQVSTKILHSVQNDNSQEITVGVCERCETPVERRELEQWFFRITEYAERLLANTDQLDWTEKVKIAQKNWIGKKTGINITYNIEGSNEKIEVFTTAPVNFGMTFLVISPEHKLVEKILSGKLNTPQGVRNKIKEYISLYEKFKAKNRKDPNKEKTGVATGFNVINPINHKAVPIWVSDFVVAGVGTGAVQGCPGHDLNDFDFAKKFGLPIVRVIVGPNGDTSEIKEREQVIEYGMEGKFMNSEFLNGLEFEDGLQRTMDWFEENNYGKRTITYHLRDWLISRQRYWGAPIPMIYCQKCADEGKSWFTQNRHSDPDSNREKNLERSFAKVYPERSRSAQDDKKWNSAGWPARHASQPRLLQPGIGGQVAGVAGWYPEENLPVLLPEISDFTPSGTGKGPLYNHPEFYQTTCPGCGIDAVRETDVSDTFLDSSWYFLRYLATDRDDIPFPMKSGKSVNPNPTEVRHDTLENRLIWLPVTSYIGGAEHAVLHLLYSRFITMVLHDLGYIDFEEPFSKFRTNGLIIKDGAKMSKSKGNVLIPDEYIRKYGADTLRTYLGFIGPFTQGGDFQDSGIEGISRFLKRVWALVNDSRFKIQDSRIEDKKRIAMLHKTIKGVTGDMEELRFNTAIAKLMTYYNFLSDQIAISREEIEVLLKLLAPFAPYIAEEMWQRVARSTWGVEKKRKNMFTSHNPQATSFKSIHNEEWPSYDPEKIVTDTVTIAIQINGKLRDTIELKIENGELINEDKVVERAAKEKENVKRHLVGKEVKKVIYVKRKIINFVV